MAPKCTVCGADGASPHVCAGDLEQTYERDLRTLTDRRREDLWPSAPPAPPEAVGLDAPASVREAIRLADTLIPVAEPSAPPAAPAPTVPPRGSWPAVAAVVLGGALLGGALVWVAVVRVPVTRIAPSVVGAIRRAEAEAAAPPAVPVVTGSVPVSVVTTSVPASVAAPPRVVAPRPLRPASKPRPTPSAAPAAAPAEPPTLMEAITASVKKGR